jgi:hypothetical protein
MANGNADAIFAKLAEAGFKVAVQDERTLSREFVEEFYGEHKGWQIYKRGEQGWRCDAQEALLSELPFSFCYIF